MYRVYIHTQALIDALRILNAAAADDCALKTRVNDDDFIVFLLLLLRNFLLLLLNLCLKK